MMNNPWTTVVLLLDLFHKKIKKKKKKQSAGDVDVVPFVSETNVMHHSWPLYNFLSPIIGKKQSQQWKSKYKPRKHYTLKSKTFL